MVIVKPGNTGAVGLSQFLEGLGPTYGVKVVPGLVRTAAEIESTIAGFGNAPDRGLIVVPDGLTTTHRDLTIAAANQSRLPAVFAFRTFAINGGLMSWGMNFSDIYRQAATYVDRILRGAEPEDLPVQAPTKFDLVINLKTAKALGLTIPPSLLAIADDVIE
jgi:ABC-type uncharacterized transport system substrate-binding protein